MTQTSLSTFLLAGPEIVLVVAALVAYLGGAFCGLRQGERRGVGARARATAASLSARTSCPSVSRSCSRSSALSA